MNIINKISFKKIFGLVSILIAIFLFGCQGNEPSCINDAYNEIIAITNEAINESIALPNKIGEVYAKYYSSDRFILENDGTLNQPEDDVEIRFTVELTYQGVTYERIFNVKVLGSKNSPQLKIFDYNANLKVGETTIVNVNFSEGYTLSWISSNTSVITVEDGVVTAVGTGTATIKVSLNEKPDIYQEVEFIVTLDMPKLIIQCDNTTLFVSETPKLTIELESGYSYKIESSDNNVIKVVNDAVTAVGVGTATVTITVVEAQHVFETIEFTVSEKPKSDTDLLEIAVGQQVDLSLLLELPNSDLIWVSNNGDIATIESGVLTAHKAGVTTITVESKQNTSYEINLNITVAVFNNDAIDYYKNQLSDEYKLLNELRDLITKTHTKKISYNDARDHFIYSDADPDKPGNIILFYTKVSVSGTWDGGKTYDREHVWPQSTGWDKDETAGSDLHHIRPTLPRANGGRSNRAYAYCPTGKKLSVAFEGTNVLAGLYTTTHFEPNDNVKGDVARIIMYLLIRYEDAGTSKAITGVAQSMTLLLEWNKLDPVDQLEINRNNYIETVQGNRNPFIDNADLAELIW